MGWNTFGHSAVFAAVAGCGVVPWILAAAPLLGMRGALAVYLVAGLAAYVGAIAPSLRRGLGVAAVVGSLGAALTGLPHPLPELVLGLGVLLALVRSALLYRSRPGRGLTLECALVGGGLLFARFLAGGTLLSLALAVWGFLLVQS